MGAEGAAHDASVQTVDAANHECRYRLARVEDCTAAVEKIKQVIAGAQATLAAAEENLAQAVADAEGCSDGMD